MATAVAALWRAVAGDESLVDAMACFQNGQTWDMLRFVKLHWKPDWSEKSNQEIRDSIFRTWLVKWTASRVPKLCHRLPHMQQHVAEYAIRHHNLDVLRAFNTPSGRLRSIPWPLVNLAASVNDLNLVKYLIESGHKGYTKLAVDHAAQHGNLEMVQFLHAHQIGGSYGGLRDAAWNGHLNVLRYLHEEMKVSFLPHPRGGATFLMNYVAARGHMNTLVYLHELGRRCSSEAMDKAAGKGQFDVVKWLHANRTEGCTKEAMLEAAIQNRLDIVQFLNENRTEGCVASTLRAACKRGYLDVVKYLVPFCASAEALQDCIGVARSLGQLDVVKCILSTTSGSALVNAGVDAAASVGDVIDETATEAPIKRTYMTQEVT